MIFRYIPFFEYIYRNIRIKKSFQSETSRICPYKDRTKILKEKSIMTPSQQNECKSSNSPEIELLQSSEIVPSD
ncbi:hypothetical protein LEP1GSC051_4015 [Leptospira sp. P2653]|nr:hypothetical protein LEP1GSC051_4015 [Leptospira sp. P2653]